MDLEHKEYEDLEWSKEYGKYPVKMFATGGPSLTIGSEYKNDTVPTIWGGPLETEYKIAQFHFHFTQKGHTGSEHQVNGYSFIMEMHAVHIKKNLTFEQATQDSNDGMAVVGYFFEYSKYPNHAIDRLIRVFEGVKRNKIAPVTLPRTFPLNELIRPFSCDYVTYRGSLTTPPCTENVRWILSPFPNGISREQMARFRNLAKNGGVSMDNIRNLQQRNDRTIYFAIRNQSHYDYPGDENDIDDDTYSDNFEDADYGKN